MIDRHDRYVGERLCPWHDLVAFGECPSATRAAARVRGARTAS
jgi:hypothetical protein